MKVELKQIIDELTEAIGLSEGHTVIACIKEDGSIGGWTIGTRSEDGTITPEPDCYFKSLKDLFYAYGK